jgi:hypothetical protein
MPAFYAASLLEHSTTPIETIVGKVTIQYGSRHVDQKGDLTRSWESTIKIVNAFYTANAQSIPDLDKWTVLYEYPIPRREKRIDVVLLSEFVVYVIEIKAGQSNFLPTDVRQVVEYALDLRDFHLESHSRPIVPILLCTHARPSLKEEPSIAGLVQDTQKCTPDSLGSAISTFESKLTSEWSIDPLAWDNSAYLPTPTIVEAAQTLYSTNSVKQISRNQAGIENLTKTTDAVLHAIRKAQREGTKIICFITGVPGAGKTLAGLNIVHGEKFKNEEGDLAVFLSGNSPLVKVLKEALTRDVVHRDKLGRHAAEHKVGTFIQNVHSFIDSHYLDPEPPPDRVLIYDEAQRAWTAAHKRRKSNGRISDSEPDLLLSIMSRFEGWAAIICLVGGGQEINTGEAGLREWGRSLETEFATWKVYISPNLKEGDDTTGHTTLFTTTPSGLSLTEIDELHLTVAIRAIRSRGLSEFVAALLHANDERASQLLQTELRRYPIVLTRNPEVARQWLRDRALGGGRTGIVASSGGRRLRAIGFDPYYGLRGDSDQKTLGAWYLNPPDDVRSSNFLEVVATEYAVQGLEIDWSGVFWDCDLSFQDGTWTQRAFKGTRWQNVSDQQKQYILNKYRVLLTRAREGMVICVPEGDHKDKTRLPKLYDGTFEFLMDIGINPI